MPPFVLKVNSKAGMADLGGFSLIRFTRHCEDKGVSSHDSDLVARIEVP